MNLFEKLKATWEFKKLVSCPRCYTGEIYISFKKYFYLYSFLIALFFLSLLSVLFKPFSLYNFLLIISFLFLFCICVILSCKQNIPEIFTIWKEDKKVEE